MSENSLPPEDDIRSFLADLRLLGMIQTADAYEHLFNLKLLYLDSDGRIMEAGAPSTAEEAL